MTKIIASMQIPSFGNGDCRPASWYEDFVLSNARIFVENGIQSIKLQDETVQPGPASHQTIARMARLGRALKGEFPDLQLGIIVQAHDPIASIAIADACDADFVRLKIFVGASVATEGLRNALGPEAVAYREAIKASHIKILADVHDRTSAPIGDVSSEMAANWCAKARADVLVITGSSFSDTLGRIHRARDHGIRKPIFIGGSVTAENVKEALAAADGAVVGSTFLRKGEPSDSMSRWDPERISAFMERVSV